MDKDSQDNPIPKDGPYVVKGGPTAISFEGDYLPNVVRQEMTEDAWSQAKEVQAIAARNFAWQKIAYGDDPPNPKHLCFAARTCDVTDSTDHQVYYPNIATNADYTAVQNTSRLFLTWSNQEYPSDVPSFTQYAKGHPGLWTVAAGDTNAYPYLLSVYDPIQPTYVKGHGIGMSQDGTLRWERGNTDLDGHSGTKYPFWNRDQILAHYYTSVQLRHTNGVSYWPNFRWNALSIDRSTFRTNRYDPVTVVVQNTGTVSWEYNTKLSVYWQRCSGNSCISYLQDPSVRPEQIVPNAQNIDPGEHYASGVTLYIQPPTNLYQGKNYGYRLWFDMRRPNGQYFQNIGWHPQQWGITIQNTPPPPTPNPPCSTPRCITPQQFAPVSWVEPDNPDPVTYVWKNTNSNQGGTTSNTNVTVPLVRGINTITVKSQDTTEFTSESDEVIAGEFLYDPDAPIINFVAPQWSNATSLNLSWNASDPSIGGATPSGIASYTVQQQMNGGPWTTLVSNTQATNYSVANLQNTTDYSFRVIAYDWAGNQTPREQTVKIDRTPPTSTLIAPSGTISQTWAVLHWISSVDRAPIVQFSIDRLINGTWPHTCHINQSS